MRGPSLAASRRAAPSAAWRMPAVQGATGLPPVIAGAGPAMVPAISLAVADSRPMSRPCRIAPASNGIGVGVEVEHAAGEVALGAGDRLRLPAEDGGGAAQDRRRRRADRQAGYRAAAAPDALAGGQGGERAVEPARFDESRRRHAALEHVLPVEMRALAIARRRRVHDERRLRADQPRKIGHARIEREEAVERQGRGRPVEAQGERAVQRGVARIADRADGRQPVERAAQHNDDEARVARAGGGGQLRDHGGGKQRAAGSDQGSARGMGDLRRGHGAQLRCISGDMRRSARPCSRLSARAMAVRVSGEGAPPQSASSSSLGFGGAFSLPASSAQ